MSSGLRKLANFFNLKNLSARYKNSFSLLEVLVVTAILAILASMLMPALQKAREKARQAVCMSNLKQISLVLGLYLQDNNGYFNPSTPISSGGPGYWDQILGPYIRTYRVEERLFCPSKRSYEPGTWTHGFNKEIALKNVSRINSQKGVFIDYAFPNFYSDAKYHDPANPDHKVAGYDQSAYRHSDGINILFVDGHIEWRGREDVIKNRIELFGNVIK